MKRVLIVNRGEIAVRIIRACRDLGLNSVALYSDADKDSIHATIADAAIRLSGVSPLETYLNQDEILRIAKQENVDAVHPGYGFLAENAAFAQKVIDAGVIWVGPPPKAIAELGDKVAARRVAKSVGAPLAPSFDGDFSSEEALNQFIEDVGLPVIIKAKDGGGGRGMRIVRNLEEWPRQLESAKREAKQSFGSDACFVERYLDRARHVETQCLADQHGTIAVLATRDCSIQRRQQKLIEEAPAPFLRDEQIELLRDVSKNILSTVDYVGAATCEFLIDQNGEIYFLEVNPRIQVEHPVTEEVTGVDIIAQMFKIASGETLEIDDRTSHGHAIEFRINAEDPAKGFIPTPGTLTRWRPPGGIGVRIDSGYGEGDTIPSMFDSLIGKLIVKGDTRQHALARSRRALKELSLEGVANTAHLYRYILTQEAFVTGQAEAFTIYTKWIDDFGPDLAKILVESKSTDEPQTTVQIIQPEQKAERNAEEPKTSKSLPPEAKTVAISGSDQVIVSPISAIVIEVDVQVGDDIEIGSPIAIVEAMKMEHEITSEIMGTIAQVNVNVGDSIENGDPICTLSK